MTMVVIVNKGAPKDALSPYFVPYNIISSNNIILVSIIFIFNNSFFLFILNLFIIIFLVPVSPSVGIFKITTDGKKEVISEIVGI